MRNLEKGQHIFIAFQDGKAVLDSQLRPRMYTSLENADRWTPTANKGKIEYVEYVPTLTPPNEPLTLERLREMDGEPVWIVDASINRQEWCYWKDGLAYSCNEHPEYYDPDEYGLWIAYRRPPEGEEDT